MIKGTLTGVLILFSVLTGIFGVLAWQEHETKIQREVLTGESELAYKINHACGKGFEMYDWSVLDGYIIIDCSSTSKGVATFNITKTISIKP